MMKLSNLAFVPILFVERQALTKGEFDVPDSDYSIMVSDPDDNTEYCKALLEKIVRLRTPSYQKEFLHYQCGLHKNPKIWLTSLNSLIAENMNFFYEEKREHLLLHIYTAITNLLTISISGSKSITQNKRLSKIDNPFNIERTKKYLEGINSLTERNRVLRRLRTDYLQSQHNFRPSGELPYDEQVKLELNHLKLLIRLKKNSKWGEDVEDDFSYKITVIGNPRILLCGFRKLLLHVGDNQQRYLQIEEIDFYHFLTKVLRDVDGGAIDQEIIAEYVMISKFDADKLSSRYDKIQFLNPLSYIQNNPANLEEVKREMKKISSIENRLIFLSRILTNMLQHQKNKSIPKYFIEQVMLEVKHQKKELKIQNRNSNTSEKGFSKITINGRVNVLMTFFYDLTETIPEKFNTTLLGNPKSEIISFVKEYFNRKENKELSVHSLRSMLTPSKWDKRCSANKQVDVVGCLTYQS